MVVFAATMPGPQWDPWIETYTGRRVYFTNPTPDMFYIEDIAHALSNMCRYTGHCSGFYSVAEHSVIVSRLVPKEFALEGLLHDGSESVLTDVASPIKPYLTNYKMLEDKIMVAIGKRFGFTWPNSKQVKAADVEALSTEAHYLMTHHGNDWQWEVVVPTGRPDLNMIAVPRCLSPKAAKQAFLERYNEILQGL